MESRPRSDIVLKCGKPGNEGFPHYIFCCLLIKLNDCADGLEFNKIKMLPH
jgi:hypothetical protein